jgi:hypothetical protein
MRTGGQLLYVGDTDEEFAYFDGPALAALTIAIEAHGKVPDVILHHTAENWLLLVEAVTSHGPVNPKRRAELKRLRKSSSAALRSGRPPGAVHGTPRVVGIGDNEASVQKLVDGETANRFP